MFLAHGALGLTAAYSTKKIWKENKYSSNYKALLYASSIITGILPDLDFIYAFFDTVKTSHHLYITHTFLPYLIINLLIIVISLFVKSKIKNLLRSFSFIFSINIILHLLADALVSKIRLLYPLSKKEFVLSNISPIIKTNNLVLSYFFTPISLFTEITILAISIFVLYKLRKDKRVFFTTFLTFTFISIIAVSMTLLFIVLL